MEIQLIFVSFKLPELMLIRYRIFMFFVDCLGDSLCRHSCCLQIGSLISSFPVLIALAGCSMLNSSGENRHFCCVPDLEEKHSFITVYAAGYRLIGAPGPLSGKSRLWLAVLFLCWLICIARLLASLNAQQDTGGKKETERTYYLRYQGP